MPFIQGESLRSKLAREGELPVAEAARILREIVDALSFAHRNGVVHRDIKPDNVLLSDGHAVVTDFGVAKAVSASSGSSSLTSLGVALGTPAYMAPEQAAADPHVDHRADIYAVGIMAYEMLAGRTPFTAPSPQAMLAAHITQAPEPVGEGPARRLPGAQRACSCAASRSAPPTAGRARRSCWASSRRRRRRAAAWRRPRQPRRSPAAPRRRSGDPTRCGSRCCSPPRRRASSASCPCWSIGSGSPTGCSPAPSSCCSSACRSCSSPDTSSDAAPWRGRAAGWSRRRRAGCTAGSPGGRRFAAACSPSPASGWRPWCTPRCGCSGSARWARWSPSGRLSERDRLIVADFENRTADSSLGTSVSEAFRIDLAQTPLVRILSTAEVGDALTRMRRDPATPVTPALAREIATREGAKAVVTGEISALGKSYVLSARILGAADGAELVALRETAGDDAGDRGRARPALGEGAGADRGVAHHHPRRGAAGAGDDRLAGGPAALQRGRASSATRDSRSRRWSDWSRPSRSTAGSPWRGVSWRWRSTTHRNSQDRVVAATTKAWEHRDRLTEIERQLAIAYYHGRWMWIAIRRRRPTGACWRSSRTTASPPTISRCFLAEQGRPKEAEAVIVPSAPRQPRTRAT